MDLWGNHEGVPLQLTNQFATEITRCVKDGSDTLTVMDQDQSLVEVSILNLPIELLDIIATYLSPRDRLKLRCVSQGLRVVSETSLLWREFVWDYYDTREEHCVKYVLKRFGKHIKRLAFPGYLTPKLNEMLRYCNNVRHVSLPVVMTLSPDQLTLLGDAVQHMKHLQTLEVGWDTEDIKPLLLIALGLKELTVCVGELRLQSFAVWVNKWVDMEFRPANLNVIFNTKFNLRPNVQELAQNWQQWNSIVPAGHTANVKFYERHRIPFNVYPIVPVFQLEFGQTAILPLAIAKQCGIQGVDYLVVTDCCRDGKIMYKATHTSVNCQQFNCTITSLHFVTHFDVGQCESFLPSHLEEVAFACPNLQQLVLARCTKCFKSLHGMRAIAKHCHNLKGLSILSISVTEVENQVELWEILSSLKLTHLITDYCLVSPCAAVADKDKDKMISLYQKCSCLVAIESSTSIHCKGCRVLVDKDLLVLHEFPSLRYLKLFNYYFKSVQGIITDCKEVKCFVINSTILNIGAVSFSYACNRNLQQLCIQSRNSIIQDEFMSSVSAHGGLVHVFLSVYSVSIVGIRALLENSPKLITYFSIVELRHENSDKKTTLTREEFLEFECTLRQKYRNRKVLNAGGFVLWQKAKYDSQTQSLKIPFKELGYTDLLQMI